LLILVAGLDVQALTSEDEDIIPSLVPAFERYNEAQLATVKLPGSSQEVGFTALPGRFDMLNFSWEGHRQRIQQG
jgi:hypothetical protein